MPNATHDGAGHELPAAVVRARGHGRWLRHARGPGVRDRTGSEPIHQTRSPVSLTVPSSLYLFPSLPPSLAFPASMPPSLSKFLPRSIKSLFLSRFRPLPLSMSACFSLCHRFLSQPSPHIPHPSSSVTTTCSRAREDLPPSRAVSTAPSCNSSGTPSTLHPQFQKLRSETTFNPAPSILNVEP